MCGIFGYSFKDKKNCSLVSEAQRGILTYLLAGFNDSRGGQSWGLVGIYNDGQTYIQKGLGTLADDIGHFLSFRTMMAHTRLATKGKVIKENSHPFEIGRIVGAHNGMIYNHEELCKKHKRDFVVDSMHIFAHMNEHKDLSELSGYGAIEWIEEGRIFLSRLHRGELSVYGIGDPKGEVEGLVWSSDDDHLEMALMRAGIHDCFPYETLKEGVAYEVTPSALRYARKYENRLNLSGWGTGNEWRQGFNQKVVLGEDDWDNWMEKEKEEDIQEMMREYNCSEKEARYWLSMDDAEEIDIDEDERMSFDIADLRLTASSCKR